MTDQPETMFWENLANVAEDASIEWDDIVAVKDDYRLDLYQHAGWRMAEWVCANQGMLLETLAEAGVLEVERTPLLEDRVEIRYVSPWKEDK